MKEQRFNKIVSENSEKIKRICSYYSSNKTDREDMYQEILINIWRSLDGFRGDSAISTWIYRIAVNTSLTYKGKIYKHMQLYIDADTNNLQKLVDTEDDHKLKEKQLAALQNALYQLSVIDKALISLALEGLSSKEIANVIGITEPNVKVKIHRVKKQLKENLNKERK